MNRGFGMSVVSGMNGMVATASPLASVVGLRVLMEGGNAIDAAIAAGSMLSLDEPYFSGLGGHGIMMLHHASSGETECLDFGGFAPREFTIDQWGTPPTYDTRNVCSAIFPAILAGWQEALDRHGSWSLAEVLRPTIDYAEAGIPMRPVVRNFIASVAEDAKAFPEFARIFLPGGRVPEVGQIVKYQDLANTLRQIASEGTEVFYKGELADRIVRYFNEQGARFTREEFAGYAPRWRDTLSTTYRGVYEVIVPKCQVCSPVILTQLNIWDRFDLKAMGHLTPESLHLGLEAAKIAFADRRTYCGDPDFTEIPYESLVSRSYAKALADGIDMRSVANERAGDLTEIGKRGGTTHLTVVDKDRNAVAITQTIGPEFGTLHVVPHTGIILNNEGMYFDLDPIGGPNYPVGGKLSQHDMCPTIMLRDGKFILAIGTPGATGIPQTIPQVISNVIDHGLGIQRAIEADRYRYYGRGEVRLAEGISKETQEAIARKGHKLLPPSPTPVWAGGFNAVMVDPKSSALTGGADPRRGGLAVGY